MAQKSAKERNEKHEARNVGIVTPSKVSSKQERRVEARKERSNHGKAAGNAEQGSQNVVKAEIHRAHQEGTDYEASGVDGVGAIEQPECRDKEQRVAKVKEDCPVERRHGGSAGEVAGIR